MSTNNKPVGVSSSGTNLYYRVRYKYDDDLKVMIPYFEKPVDMFKMIQVSKNSTDISAIVKRAAAGDLSVLHVHNGTYADISDMPDNLNDMHSLNTEALNSFAALDPKLQALFNNDVNVFAEAVADGSYIATINNYVLANNKNNNTNNDNGGNA